MYTNEDMTAFTGLSFSGMTTLNLGGGDNKVNLSTDADPYLHTINAGGGNNVISTDNIDVTINLGNGNNTLIHAGAGSIINAGTGKNVFTTSNDILINGSTAQDEIVDDAGNVLHGAIGSDNTESQWIRGPDGTRYGLNSQGQLAIKDVFGNTTFVANYQGGPFVPFDQQTDGILVGIADFQTAGLFDLKVPFSQGLAGLFKAYNDIGFTQTGKPLLNNSFDPLVFDLTGDGINLTGVSSATTFARPLSARRGRPGEHQLPGSFKPQQSRSSSRAYAPLCAVSPVWTDPHWLDDEPHHVARLISDVAIKRSEAPSVSA